MVELILCFSLILCAVFVSIKAYTEELHDEEDDYDFGAKYQKDDEGRE